jgi:hypothetical protein
MDLPGWEVTNNHLIHGTILLQFQRSSSSPPPPPPFLRLLLLIFLILRPFFFYSSSSSSLFFTSSFITSCFPSPLPPLPSSYYSFSSSCILQLLKFGLMTDVHSVQSKALALHLFYTHTAQVQLNIGNPFNLSLTSPPPGQLFSNFLTVL